MVGLDRSVKFAEIDNVEIVDDSDLRQILIKFDNSLNEGFGEKSPLDKAGSENDKNKKKKAVQSAKAKKGKKLVQTTLPFLRKRHLKGARGRSVVGSQGHSDMEVEEAGKNNNPIPGPSDVSDVDNDGEKEKKKFEPDNLDSSFKQFDLPENITLDLNSTMVMVGYNEIALYIAGLISFFIAVFFVCFHVMLFL